MSCRRVTNDVRRVRGSGIVLGDGEDCSALRGELEEDDAEIGGFVLRLPPFPWLWVLDIETRGRDA